MTTSSGTNLDGGPGNGSADWRPCAAREMLRLRAALLARVRGFFAQRDVLEVDTPLVVNSPVTDVHIHSARVTFEASAPASATPAPYFLHTSPEYAMKRLLAAGVGDIYQICHVVRALERGRLHNAEFTLIEWYRLGFSLDALMSEVEALMRELLGAAGASRVGVRVSYREAFLQELTLDPFTVPHEKLVERARQAGFDGPARDRDELLELLMGTVVGPRLGQGALTFVHGYPASQAALARLDPLDPRAAQRFELYCDGIELANGFHELASPSEQRIRFERDIAERRRVGLPDAAIDGRLLAALESGLPDCSGVALGFDRALMIAAGAQRIDAVLPFPIERA
ncbi:MAG: EF-P lysine aminoacylase EpmA [Steroidobacteraceae bacterium]